MNNILRYINGFMLGMIIEYMYRVEINLYVIIIIIFYIIVMIVDLIKINKNENRTI